MQSMRKILLKDLVVLYNSSNERQDLGINNI